jgi:hypothetical protein
VVDGDVALVSLSGATGATNWVKPFGSANTETASAVAVDSTGNIAITGLFQVATNLGGGNVAASTPGGDDIFLAKYGSDGTFRWAKAFGSSGNDQGYGVAADPSTGNLVMTGRFSGGSIFGCSTISPYASGIFLAGYDPAGNCLWARATGAFPDAGRAVRIDARGNLVVAGSAASAVDFGVSVPGNLQINAFAATFTISGNAAPTYRWLKYFGAGGALVDRWSVGASTGSDAALDPSGNVSLAGSFFEAIDFGGVSINGGPFNNAFTAKYTR